ncbi:hypothetical protein D3C84_336400 [compost metagenome]
MLQSQAVNLHENMRDRSANFTSTFLSPLGTKSTIPVAALRHNYMSFMKSLRFCPGSRGLILATLVTINATINYDLRPGSRWRL